MERPHMFFRSTANISRAFQRLEHEIQDLKYVPASHSSEHTHDLMHSKGQEHNFFCPFLLVWVKGALVWVHFTRLQDIDAPTVCFCNLEKSLAQKKSKWWVKGKEQGPGCNEETRSELLHWIQGRRLWCECLYQNFLSSVQLRGSGHIKDCCSVSDNIRQSSVNWPF